jgi:hypothetical protein
MDPAKKKRVLKLLGGRSTDRAQALELLIALEDDGLWREALQHLRTTQVVGITQISREDLPLLAAAPDHLPEVRALRSGPRQMYFNTEVSPEAGCLTHLEEIHLTAAWGGDDPKAVPTFAHLARCPVRELHLIGVDLEEGSALGGWPLRLLDLRGGTWSTLPVLPHLEVLTASLRDAATTLGAGLPALRRLEIDAAGLTDLRALAGATHLEEVQFDDAAALRDLGPVAEAAAGGAPLRALRVLGAASLFDLSAVEGITTLEHLEVEADVDALGPLAAATGLTWLGVRKAPRLRDLGPVAAFSGLQCLDLRGDTALTDLTPLLGLPALRVVALAGTSFAPADVPAVLRPYCTWAETPGLASLVGRPRHPDDPRGAA